jgi:nitronate monooxygenase
VGVWELLEVPIVQAPLSGGPSTPALAAAVSQAGGLGFLAAGYKAAGDVEAEIAAVQEQTQRPFGVNLFARPSGDAPEPLRAFVQSLGAEAQRSGVALGEPRFSDDEYDAKLAVLQQAGPAVASFTFGCPTADEIAALKEAGSNVWVTVTTTAEAVVARGAGADALVVQGAEAGGHRGTFADTRAREDIGLLALLALVQQHVDRPLVAAGGIMTGAGIAAVLTAGAKAAALGTAFMRCPEAGTSEPHRKALQTDASTALTRAFTGRLARGIVNRWQVEHSADAPIAYPEIHYVTAPVRAHARQHGDADSINLWAGQAHALGRELPAAELIGELMTEARAARAQLDRRPW